jgi:hypothetical protein
MNALHTNPAYQRAKRHAVWLLQQAEEDEQADREAEQRRMAASPAHAALPGQTPAGRLAAALIGLAVILPEGVFRPQNSAPEAESSPEADCSGDPLARAPTLDGHRLTGSHLPAPADEATRGTGPTSGLSPHHCALEGP